MRRDRRKLFVPGGLIALSVFTLFGMIKIAEFCEKQSQEFHTMEVNWPPSTLDLTPPLMLPPFYPEERNFRTFNVGGDSIENYLAFRNGKRLMNEIKRTKDTFTGVHFSLDPDATWQDFINVLEICNEKFPPVYVPYGDGVYAWYCCGDTSYIPREKLDEMIKKGRFRYD